MSEPDPEQTTRNEPERSAKRSRIRRRSKQGREQESKRDEEPKQQPSGQGSKPPPGIAEPTGGFDASGKVSSLLESTGEDVKQLLKAADDASKKIREAAQTEPSDSAESGQGGEGMGDAGSLVARINREVQQVLETADDAADKIREEARAEARQVIAEARRRAETVTTQQMDQVSKMTEQVLEELSGIQGRLGRLQEAYDHAMRAMGADLGVEEARVWETQRNGQAETEEDGDKLRRRLGKRSSRKGAQEPEEISEGARLLALQQMMAGVDPKVIEGRLRDEFNIEDPKPILDWMGLHATPRAKSQKSQNP